LIKLSNYNQYRLHFLGADLGLHSSYASAAKFAKLEWLQTTFRHIC